MNYLDIRTPFLGWYRIAQRRVVLVANWRKVCEDAKLENGPWLNSIKFDEPLMAWIDENAPKTGDTIRWTKQKWLEVFEKFKTFLLENGPMDDLEDKILKQPYREMFLIADEKTREIKQWIINQPKRQLEGKKKRQVTIEEKRREKREAQNKTAAAMTGAEQPSGLAGA